MFTKIMTTARLTGLTLTLLLWATGATTVNAGEMQVPLNLPSLVNAPVVPGQTQVEFTLPMGATDVLQLEVIAPVPGVELTLLDPDGVIILEPGNEDVSFLDGAILTPALPGGKFLTPAINDPADGDWTLRLTFPPAPERTIVQTTSYIKTPYGLGLVVNRGTARVNQPKPMQVMVLKDGKAVTGLNPVVTVTAPSGATEEVILHNDGNTFVNADMNANDSVYSNAHAYKEVGTHQLEATLTIPMENGQELVRTVTGQVEIIEPRMSVLDIEGEVITGLNNCVEALNVKVNAESYEDNKYNVSVWLKDVAGEIRRVNRGKPVTAGPFEISVPYPVEELREKLGDGPFSIQRLNIISYGELTEGSEQEFDTYDLDLFPNITGADFCYPPIHLMPGLEVTERLDDGFIAALDFNMTLKVAEEGRYKVTFKVTDAAGDVVEEFFLQPYLYPGDNDITYSLPADRVQGSDGPFEVQDLLAEGGYETLQKSRVGETAEYSRWQFYPTRAGDLDNDGDVDEADRAVLIEQRNQPALVPGDRRDVTGDGVINGADVRYLLKLR